MRLYILLAMAALTSALLLGWQPILDSIAPTDSVTASSEPPVAPVEPEISASEPDVAPPVEGENTAEIAIVNPNQDPAAGIEVEAPQGDAAEEWARIKATTDPMQVIAYLGANPPDEYREQALNHLAVLLADEQVTQKSPELLAPAPTPAPATGFEGTLNGVTLEALLTSSPKFPPIDGLRDDVWKGKTCKSCHKWNLEILCTQAKTYLKPSFDPKTEQPHPFGVEFRVALRTWAEGGCK